MARATSETLKAIFDAWRLSGDQEELLREVAKVGAQDFDFKTADLPETDTIGQDIGQDLSIEVWKKLPTFVGNGSDFARYVYTVRSSLMSDAIAHAVQVRESKPYQLVSKKGEEYDNPKTLAPMESKRNGKAVPHYYRQASVQLPDWLSEDEELICGLIADGLRYREIGALLNLKEEAVKQRVRYLKRRATAERTATKKETACSI